MQSLEVSGEVRPMYGSLGVKRLKCHPDLLLQCLQSLGKQNVKLLSQFFRNFILQSSIPISWISPTKYFTVFFVDNFRITKLFGPSGWAVQSAPSSQLPSSVKSSVSCGINSESDVSEFFYSCVTHVLTSFLGLGLEGPVGLVIKFLNTFLLRCHSHSSLCFPSAVHHFCLLWMQAFDMDERLLESPSFQQSCLIVIRTVFPSPLTELLEQRVH